MTDLTLTVRYVRPLVGSTVVPKTAGEAMTVGDLVYPFSDDTVKKCDADTFATVNGQVWMVVAGGRHEPDGAIITNERVTCLEFGRVELGPDQSLLDAAHYFASNTAGKIADAAGTVPRRIGSPESDHVLFFNPNTVAPTS
jgi:hypothetical protein